MKTAFLQAGSLKGQARCSMARRRLMYRRGMKLGLLLSESRRHWATRPGRWRDSSRNCFTCWGGEVARPGPAGSQPLSRPWNLSLYLDLIPGFQFKPSPSLVLASSLSLSLATRESFLKQKIQLCHFLT